MDQQQIDSQINGYVNQVFSSILTANVQAKVLELNVPELAPAKANKAEEKPAEEKPAAKKTAVSENVFVQYLGSEITSADLIAKAKKASGVKSPKTVNVYVKPEENKVYYVVDNNVGSFDLV